MRILTTLHISYDALRIHKVRSLLTVLGLIIGVTSIIVVMNLGQSIKEFIIRQVEIFGTDYIEVEIKVPSVSKKSSANAFGIAQGVSITTLKEKDAEAILKHPNIRDLYYALIGQEIVSFEHVDKTAMLWGVSGSFFNLNHAKVIEGRGFTDEENKSQARIAVIGPKIKNDLFGENDAIGKRIKIGNKKFTVVGVMEKQGEMFFLDMDSVVYTPIRTLQKQIMGVDYIQFILAYMIDTKKVKSTSSDITDIMREQHSIVDPKKDDFAVTSSEEAMDILGVITRGISLLLIAIAAISLMVGGVGIMNIMYVSVSERTYEIGLRKALGATDGNILWQFLWEAVFLTFSGGVIGVLLGTLLSFGGSYGARLAGLDWSFHFSLSGLILAVAFSIIIGLLFGIYPAKKAAEMQPVEALRHE